MSKRQRAGARRVRHGDREEDKAERRKRGLEVGAERVRLRQLANAVLRRDLKSGGGADALLVRLILDEQTSPGR
jgi:hypothetical protein